MNRSQIHKYIHKKYQIDKNKYPRVSNMKEFSRRNIYELCNELGFKHGAEIGVRIGTNAKQMCKSIPELKLICVDPWFKERGQLFYERAKKKLEPFNATLMKMTSMEAVHQIKNRSLDFVYIDGRHNFDNVMLDLIHWVPKVKRNGIISGHDYVPQCGVPQAVNAYTANHGIVEVFLTRDVNRSFLWVNP